MSFCKKICERENKLEDKIVVLSGAGISRESGLDTFRDRGGIWDQYSPQKVASIAGFRADPELVQEFYNMRRVELLSGKIEPNPAHFALSRLQGFLPNSCYIVTQNIDDLHSRAGSKEVIHIHGETLGSLCSFCGMRMRCETSISAADVCEKCLKVGGIRPDVVFFGEIPYHLPRVYELLKDCTLFVAIGTAGAVYPAAGFVDNAVRARKIEINLAATEISDLFDENRYGKASVEVPRLVEELLAEA